MSVKNSTTILWFRDDLRLDDNPALNSALSGSNLIAIYIYQPNLVFNQSGLGAANKVWLHYALKSLENDLRNKLKIKLNYYLGDPKKIVPNLCDEHKVSKIVWNRRYYPYLVEQDSEIKSTLVKKGIEVLSFNANLLIEPWEGRKSDNKPFLVFTPFYKNAVKKFTFDQKPLLLPTKNSISCLEDHKSQQLEDLKLLPKINWYGGILKNWNITEEEAQKKIKKFVSKSEDYSQTRNTPSVVGTSRLSPYLRFGMISPRRIIFEILNAYDQRIFDWQYIKEIYWREFAYHLLFYFPSTVDQPLKEKFSKFPWLEDDLKFNLWTKGKTGYPLVDAGMRELWFSGWMHNRVRMVVGSFLVKHLLIPWQKGADWFADTLVDGDLASNTLGWQWVSGCGADAAPYFRVFNPLLQSEKFDPNGDYIRTWISELKAMQSPQIHQPFEGGVVVPSVLKTTYPEPIIEHIFARNRALKAYEKIK